MEIDIINFKEDVAKEYAKRRKNIQAKEVEDIINCLIRFLKDDIAKENEYAYMFPKIGTLYKGFYEEYEEKKWYTKNKRLNQQWLDIVLHPSDKHLHRLERPTLLEQWHPDKSLEQIEEWQNSSGI